MWRTLKPQAYGRPFCKDRVYTLLWIVGIRSSIEHKGALKTTRWRVSQETSLERGTAVASSVVNTRFKFWQYYDSKSCNVKWTRRKRQVFCVHVKKRPTFLDSSQQRWPIVCIFLYHHTFHKANNSSSNIVAANPPPTTPHVSALHLPSHSSTHFPHNPRH